MGRADLSRLLGNVGESIHEEAVSQSAEDPAVLVPEPASMTLSPALAEAPPRQVKRAGSVAKPTPEVEPGATYLRFVRKETRLRDEQQNALTTHARRLSRARSKSAPRITDNTLIRVAVDLLLERIESASGDDEAAILKSLKQ